MNLLRFLRRGLSGPQGPVAPLGEKLPGQGHGDVPSIRSAAVVSAEARAPRRPWP